MSSPAGGPGLQTGQRLLQWLQANRRKLALSLASAYVLTAGVVAVKALSGEQAVHVPPKDDSGPEPTRAELDQALQWQVRMRRYGLHGHGMRKMRMVVAHAPCCCAHACSAARHELFLPAARCLEAGELTVINGGI